MFLTNISPLSNITSNSTYFHAHVDLERAFYAQVANHFTEAEIIGCLFHFKQALCRKMIKLGIPDDEVKYCMRKGIIDLLTAIPKDDLTKGVNFIAAMIFDYCAE
jgi:hypothetical protein